MDNRPTGDEWMKQMQEAQAAADADERAHAGESAGDGYEQLDDDDEELLGGNYGDEDSELDAADDDDLDDDADLGVDDDLEDEPARPAKPLTLEQRKAKARATLSKKLGPDLPPGRLSAGVKRIVQRMSGDDARFDAEEREIMDDVESIDWGAGGYRWSSKSTRPQP